MKKLWDAERKRLAQIFSSANRGLMSNQEVHKVDNTMVGRTVPKNPCGGAPPLSTLIGRSVSVVLTNLVFLNGVARLGWNAVPLVLMFILESVVVLLTDSIKRFFDRGGKDTQDVFVIECAFILFYGFFASIVFGPYDSLQTALEDGFHIQRALISGELRISLVALVFTRLVRLGHDLMDSGAFGGKVRRKLQLDGRGWIFLLFFAVMLAPLIAKSGPNPAGGLTALVVLKTLGEIFAVWAVRIRGMGPKSVAKNEEHRR
jgi:hypothetical protein